VIIVYFALGAFAHSREKRLLASLCLSVSVFLVLSPSFYPHVSDELPVDGLFSGKLLLATFTEMCREIKNFVKSRTKISRVSHEDFSTFCCCRRHEVTLKAMLTATSSGWREVLYTINYFHSPPYSERGGLKYTTNMSHHHSYNVTTAHNNMSYHHSDNVTTVHNNIPPHSLCEHHSM
jgi:hypothetical protein